MAIVHSRAPVLFSMTERTQVRRGSDRGVYDLDTIYRIIDAALICHVSYVHEGEPRVIPTALVRIDDHIYIHGNRRSAMITHLEQGGQAAVCITHLDGLVVARSGFHCSMNYRSVILYGTAELVVGNQNAAKLGAMNALVNGLIPGHAEQVRAATPQEIAATTVLRIAIDEASAKVREGDPIDDAADLELDIWAGVIPIASRTEAAIDAGNLKPTMCQPDYISNYRRRLQS